MLQDMNRFESPERCDERTPPRHTLSAALSPKLSTSLVDVVSKLDGMLEGVRGYERRIEALEQDLGHAQSEEKSMAERLTSAEERAARVTSLYVATYQLHASLDPADVRATIGEIASNLLGAERFALLLRGTSAGPCEVALEHGASDGPSELFADGRYVGHDPMIDATLNDGVLRIAESAKAPVIAAVPLVVQDTIVGALVIFTLLRHRGSLAAHDRDLLDLLAAHAASALFIAQVHESADRKLKTLESLVKLAQRG
jgi:hypothetical protein